MTALHPLARYARALEAEMYSTRIRNRTRPAEDVSLKGRTWPDVREASISRCSCGSWAWEGACSTCTMRAVSRARRIAQNAALMRQITYKEAS